MEKFYFTCILNKYLTIDEYFIDICLQSLLPTKVNKYLDSIKVIIIIKEFSKCFYFTDNKFLGNTIRIIKNLRKIKTYKHAGKADSTNYVL